MNHINDVEVKPSKPNPNNWWCVLACLPIAYVIQTMFLTTLAYESAAMVNTALWIDVAILLRSIVGLIWQPRSQDWRLYLGAQLACISFIWGLCLLGNFFYRA